MTDDVSEYSSRQARLRELEAQAETMSLTQLAAEIARRCAEILNNHSADMDEILATTERLHKESKTATTNGYWLGEKEGDAYHSVRRDMDWIKGAFEQLAPLNSVTGRYESLGEQQVLSLLQEHTMDYRRRTGQDYRFHSGTIIHVADTYSGEVKAVVDKTCQRFFECDQPTWKEVTGQFENIYTAVHEQMVFGQRALDLIADKPKEQRRFDQRVLDIIAGKAEDGPLRR